MSTKTNELIVEVPEGVQASLEGSVLAVKGEKGELRRDFAVHGLPISMKENKIKISVPVATKKITAIAGALKSHMENMFKGVTQGFTYKMKIVYSHFPMTLKQEGDIIVINNFLGEKAPRKSKVFGNCKVSITKDEVVIESINKEDAGQTTANLEQATKIKKKDSRVFQDGVYVVEKPK